MKPKEKAEELIYKFALIENEYKEYLTYKQCKDCVIILVDEILNFQENLFITEGSMAFNYWQEVKNEI